MEACFAAVFHGVENPRPPRLGKGGNRVRNCPGPGTIPDAEPAAELEVYLPEPEVVTVVDGE